MVGGNGCQADFYKVLKSFLLAYKKDHPNFPFRKSDDLFVVYK